MSTEWYILMILIDIKYLLAKHVNEIQIKEFGFIFYAHLISLCSEHKDRGR